MGAADWLEREFDRAEARSAMVPAHARPTVTRPLVDGKRVPQPSELVEPSAYDPARDLYDDETVAKIAHRDGIEDLDVVRILLAVRTDLVRGWVEGRVSLGTGPAERVAMILANRDAARTGHEARALDEFDEISADILILVGDSSFAGDVITNVCDKWEVERAEVNGAMWRLVRNGLLNYSDTAVLTLTDRGRTATSRLLDEMAS